MKLSFVVPAHNEEAHIVACVQAIQRSLTELAVACDIVVVADSCQDQTAELAAQAGARVIEVGHRQIAATRNAGAAQVQGDVLFFIDADTRVNAAVVRAACLEIQKGALGGGALFRFDRPIPLYARILERWVHLMCRLTHWTGGCIFYCRADVFRQLGGFNTQLYAAEELDLAARIKKRGRFRVVPYAVDTSARKLRAYSGWDIIKILIRLTLKGPRALYDRSGLELWYQRREEGSQAR